MKLLIDTSTNKVVYKSSIQFNADDNAFIAEAISFGIALPSPVVVNHSDDDYHVPIKYYSYDPNTDSVSISNELSANLDDITKDIKISDVNYIVSDYQSRLIGTNDSYELERYRLNAIIAKEYVNSTLSTKLTTEFQSYLDSLLLIKPVKFEGFDLLKFSKWILILQEFIDIGLLRISTISNRSKLEILSNSNTDWNVEVESAYNDLILLRASTMYNSNCIDNDSLSYLTDISVAQGITVETLVNNTLGE